MGNPQRTFGWVDVIVPDQEAGKAFYSKLFGWEHDDLPIDIGGYYTMFHRGGKQIAGLAQTQPGLNSAWNSYILVDDADGITGRAPGLGGTVLMPPVDVMDAGRIAMLSDPTGAVFGLWQSGKHHGADLFGEHGSIAWNELAARGVDKALPFYESLFGWSWDHVETPTPYNVAKLGDRQIAGANEMRETWPADTPSHWDVYFEVDDAHKIAKQAKKLGATQVAGPLEIPTVGTFYYLADPQGAMFYAIKSEPPA